MKKHVDNIISHFKKYVCTKLDALSTTSPMIAVMRPLVSRVVENKMPEVEKFIRQIADKEGMIDVEEIFDEMVESIMNTNVVKTHTQGFGNMEIGNGKLSFDLPIVDKKVIMDKNDLIELKQMLIK